MDALNRTGDNWEVLNGNGDQYVSFDLNGPGDQRIESGLEHQDTEWKASRKGMENGRKIINMLG